MVPRMYTPANITPGPKLACPAVKGLCPLAYWQEEPTDNDGHHSKSDPLSWYTLFLTELFYFASVLCSENNKDCFTSTIQRP
jgi:hypothetical protein